MATIAQELQVKISANANSFNNALANIKKKTSSFSSFAVSSIKKVSLAFIGLTGTATYFAKGLVQSAMKFEEQMANVFTLIDNLDAKTRVDLIEGVKRLAGEYGESTDTLTKGLYDTISASIDASHAIEFLEIATKAAKAGVTDTAVSVDILTTMVNSYKEGLGGATTQTEQARIASDYLFATVKKGKTTLQELSQYMGPVVAIAANAGLSIEDLSAAMATLTKGGLKTDIAATGLKGMLMNIMKASEEAKGAAGKIGFDFSIEGLKEKGLLNFLEELKTKMDKYNQEIQKNNPQIKQMQENLGHYSDILKNLEEEKLFGKNLSKEKLKSINEQIKKTKFQIKELKEMMEKIGGEKLSLTTFFGNVRALTAVSPLLGKMNQDFKEMNKYMQNVSGQTDTAFTKIAETSQFQIKKMIETLKVLGIEIGTQILIPLAKWVNETKNLRESWMQYIKDADLGGKFIAFWQGIFAIVSEVWGILKNIGVEIKSFSDATGLTDLLSYVNQNTVAITKFSDAVKAIGLVINTFVSLAKIGFLEISLFIQDIVIGIELAWRDMINDLSNLWTSLKLSIMEVAYSMITTLQKAMETAGKVLPNYVAIAAQMEASVSKIGGSLANARTQQEKELKRQEKERLNFLQQSSYDGSALRDEITKTQNKIIGDWQGDNQKSQQNVTNININANDAKDVAKKVEEIISKNEKRKIFKKTQEGKLTLGEAQGVKK